MQNQRALAKAPYAPDQRRNFAFGLTVRSSNAVGETGLVCRPTNTLGRNFLLKYKMQDSFCIKLDPTDVTFERGVLVAYAWINRMQFLYMHERQLRLAGNGRWPLLPVCYQEDPMLVELYNSAVYNRKVTRVIHRLWSIQPQEPDIELAVLE